MKNGDKTDLNKVLSTNRNNYTITYSTKQELDSKHFQQQNTPGKIMSDI